jgi:two-component system chemotaxis response regulator CheY
MVSADREATRNRIEQSIYLGLMEALFRRWVSPDTGSCNVVVGRTRVGDQAASEISRDVFPFEEKLQDQVSVSRASTILLVDDDTDIRSLTRTFLEHEGYSVLSSGDADRAAQIFRTSPQVDLLVTDLYMPGRSGMELARELKALRSELPVLMISGGLLDRQQRAGLEQEGWSFLAKPFLLPDLLATVHGILAPVEAIRAGLIR